MSNVKRPQRPLTKEQVLPILFLADRMAHANGAVEQKEESVIDNLAAAAGIENFREQLGYPLFGENEACKALNAESAKTGALVMMSLVLKRDCHRSQPEHGYFSQIRSKLNADPITVPIEFEAHTRLARSYIS